MDPVTHALTGYVIGNAVYNETIKDRFNTTLNAFRISTVLAAVSPDVDIVTTFIGGNTLYFISHRTLTHSPAGLIILSILSSLIVKLVRREQNYYILFIGAFLGAISHTILDLTNVYSTLAFWPFSKRMFSLNLLPIIDYYLLGLYFFSVLSFLAKPLKPYRRIIFSSVLIIAVGYIGVKAYIQHNLKNYITSQYENGGFSAYSSSLKMDRISVLASSLNSGSWNFIIENDEEYIKGSIRLVDHNVFNISSVKKKPLDKAMQRASETPLGKFVLNFSPFVDYAEDNYKGGYIVRMIDLRYDFRTNIAGREISSSRHTFGGYVVLDKDCNPVYWSVAYPGK